MVWKENKARRKKEKLTGALRREGDQRLRVEYALRICTRQSENLKSEEGKSKEKAQQEVYIGGARNASQRRGGKPNDPSFDATLVPLRFANRQTMMTTRQTVRSGAPFKNALIEASTTQFCLLEFSAKHLTL